MIDSRAFLNIPIKFKNYCTVYPPTIKDTLEDPNFNKYLSILTISQEDIEDQIFDEKDSAILIKEGEIPTPYEYLIMLMLSNEVFEKIVKDGFKFFTKSELTFLKDQKILLLGNIEDIVLKMNDTQDLPILKSEDFFEFQNCIRMAMGLEVLEPYNYNIHPKKRRMLAMRRLRDRVKAKQNSKNSSFLNNLVSICCMGIGITPLNIGEMSYASIFALIGKYQMKERYDIDIRSLMAGASSKKVKPKYWMQEEN